MRQLLVRTGSWDKLCEIPLIHIAGTKGKGSAVAMVESILRSHGLRTGSFTSPHLVCVQERFRINGSPISKDVFATSFWHVWEALCCNVAFGLQPEEPSAGSAKAFAPGFFHFLFLVGMHIFCNCEPRPEVCIIEVGLGGRLDATSAIPTPLVCGVTRLDYDHVNVLGPTLTHIAREKAGIFRAGVPALTVEQEAEAIEALQAAAASCPCPLATATIAQAQGLGISTAVQRGKDSLLADIVALAATKDRSPAAAAPASGSSLWAVAHHPALRSRPGRIARPATLAPVERADTAATTTLGLNGSFQMANAALAVGLCHTFLQRLEPWRRRRPTAASGQAAASDAVPLVPALLPSLPPTLSPAFRSGLQRASWPGRAHLVSCTFSALRAAGRHTEGSAASPGPRALVCIDGAHTAQSMLAAARWFAETSDWDRAARPASAPPPRRFLLFNCGFEKDAASLLMPLSQLGGRGGWAWEAAVFCPFDMDKPGLKPAPTLQDLLCSGGDPDPGASAALVSAAGGAAGTDEAVAWQRTLAAAFGLCERPGVLDELRRGVLERLGRPAAAAAAAGEAAASAGGTVVCDSVVSALGRLADLVAGGPAAALAEGLGEGVVAAGHDVHVLVTGSLYLAGNVLGHLGWVAGANEESS